MNIDMELHTVIHSFIHIAQGLKPDVSLELSHTRFRINLVITNFQYNITKK
jgi:hypothetical protein